MGNGVGSQESGVGSGELSRVASRESTALPPYRLTARVTPSRCSGQALSERSEARGPKLQ
jgi:hypothetical protein